MEDKAHITRCPQAEAAAVWSAAVNALIQWMKEEQTDPNLTQALAEGLEMWRSGTTTHNDTPASQKQAWIGWGAALDGWLTIEWRAQQEQYWLQWRRKKSSKRWVTELIKKLWNISWDMWAHRNGVLHDAQQRHVDIIDSGINDRVTALYRWGVHAVPRDAIRFFHTPLEDLLEHASEYKAKWIRSVEAAIERKRHHNFGQFVAEQRFMRTWLGLDA